MGELFDYAQEHARIVAQRKAERRQQEAIEQSKKDREREISSRRAAEFVSLMRRHKIPTVPLLDDIKITPCVSTGLKMASLLLPRDVAENMTNSRIETKVIANGWIAVETFLHITDEMDVGVFVSDTIETYFYQELDYKAGRYKKTTNAGYQNHIRREGDRALSGLDGYGNDIRISMANVLRMHGIV